MLTIISKILIGLYAGLTLLALGSSLKEGLQLSLILFGLGSILLLLAIFLQKDVGIYTLASGLIVLFVAAVLHGLKTETHLTHHLIRVAFSIITFVLYYLR